MNETIASKSPDLYNCKSCGYAVVESYCANCGQKKITERFTVINSLEHLLSIVANIEKGLWPTVAGLIKSPDKVISDFLKGVTNRYIHPFRYLILLLSVQTLLLFSSGFMGDFQGKFGDSFSEGFKIGSGSQTSEQFQEYINQTMFEMNSYMNFFYALSIPILALCMLILFRKSKLNYAEHLIIASYGYSQVLLIGMIFIPLMIIDTKWFFISSAINVFIGFLYFVYYFHKVYANKIWKSIIKGVLSYIAFFMSFSILIGVFIIGKMTFYYAEHKDDFKQPAVEQVEENGSADEVITNP